MLRTVQCDWLRHLQSDWPCFYHCNPWGIVSIQKYPCDSGRPAVGKILEIKIYTLTDPLCLFKLALTFYLTHQCRRDLLLTFRNMLSRPSNKMFWAVSPLCGYAGIKLAPCLAIIMRTEAGLIKLQGVRKGKFILCLIGQQGSFFSTFVDIINWITLTKTCSLFFAVHGLCTTCIIQYSLASYWSTGFERFCQPPALVSHWLEGLQLYANGGENWPIQSHHIVLNTRKKPKNFF